MSKFDLNISKNVIVELSQNKKYKVSRLPSILSWLGLFIKIYRFWENISVLNKYSNKTVAMGI